MEGAAGVGGIIKTALQLREKAIFPHLNLVTPSRRIAWADAPVTVPTEIRPWPAADTRRALVNGFGVTGTIASIVLEEAPPSPAAPEQPEPAVDERPGELLTLSAKSRKSLRRLAERHLDHLARNPDLAVADLCRTSNIGRAHFRHRIAEVVRDQEGAVRLLRKRLAALEQGDTRGGGSGAPKVAFLFPGAGAQYPGMGAVLYRQYPAFRTALDAADRILTPLTGVPIGRAGARRVHRARAHPRGPLPAARPVQPRIRHGAALAVLGVRPSVLIGHSLGEFAAAVTAGLFSLEDAARVVAARGRLSDRVQGKGGMAAVGAAAAEIAPLVEGYPDLVIGAVNGPGQCLLTGERLPGRRTTAPDGAGRQGHPAAGGGALPLPAHGGDRRRVPRGARLRGVPPADHDPRFQRHRPRGQGR